MSKQTAFVEILKNSPKILAEAAISERLSRYPGITMDPLLFNTPLIFDTFASQTMIEIYTQYRNIALAANLPFFFCAPTWRVNPERVEAGGFDKNLNRQAVEFAIQLKERWQDESSPVFAGALLGPKNDCYTPAETLPEEEAVAFHAWQVNELVETGTDYLLVQGMPAVSETLGFAKLMSDSGVPYILSFVINKLGQVLDGTPLVEAVQQIDDAVKTPPVGYMVNCVYPTFIQAERQPTELFERLIGIQANASSKSHDELDGSLETIRDDINDWTREMLKLNHEFGVKILGGCCGTDDTYLRSLVD
jgi:S-methylmethionine-dependent homocysteine/selenocysteine methylase